MVAELDVPVAPSQVAVLQKDPDKAWELYECATSFRRFLDFWHFLDQESKQTRILGEVLWPSQEELVDAMEKYGKVYALKARKLGETTLAIAYDAWVLRFRGANERVHLFSRRDDAAQELLKNVKYGLRRLPPHLQLPVAKDTTHELILRASDDDERLAKAYPADEDTAVEATCTHAHVDEWARMGNPQRVWQAIEPSIAGTAHLITTGMGPQNYTAQFWRRSLAGDTEYEPVFIDALKRTGRDEKWLAQKRGAMTEEMFRREYAMRWEDALYGGGEFKFGSKDIDAAGEGAVGQQDAILEPYEIEIERKNEHGKLERVKVMHPAHVYVKAWDVGRHKDAAVGIVLDVTPSLDENFRPYQVVAYKRLRNAPYPIIQSEIEHMHDDYPGMTWIEDNAAGEAVRENLDLPDHEVQGFKTSGVTKPKIINGVELALENGKFKFDASAFEQLDDELRSYQVPDHGVTQDSVMALAIALAKARSRVKKGRMRRILHV